MSKKILYQIFKKKYQTIMLYINQDHSKYKFNYFHHILLNRNIKFHLM